MVYVERIRHRAHGELGDLIQPYEGQTEHCETLAVAGETWLSFLPTAEAAQKLRSRPAADIRDRLLSGG
jgi:hypothetical protein